MAAKRIAGWIGAVVLLAGCQPSASTTPDATVRDRQGVARDSSGENNHGLNQGVPVVGVPGRHGTAYLFEDAGFWIQVPSNDKLNPGPSSFLLVAWINLPAPPADGKTVSVVRKGLLDASGGDFMLEIDSDGRVQCTLKEHMHLETKEGPDTDVADGRWHWVGCARSPRRLAAIVDDAWTSTAIRTKVVNNDLPLAIGSAYGDGEPFGGRIDEVVFYVAARVMSLEGGGLSLKWQIEYMQQPRYAVGIWHLDEADEE
jgi:hypothetical protein